jgi:protein disulfide-isomerase A1
MIKQSLPAVSILAKESLDEFKTADKVVVVAFLDSADKSSNETFTAIAEKGRNDFLFGAVHDAAVAEAEGVTVPGVVVYKKFDEGKDVFDGGFTTAEIESFVKAAAIPLVGEVGPDTYQGYMAAGIPLAYIFSETAEERAELGEELKPLAQEYKGVINFATIDAKSFGAHAGNLNLDAGVFPAFAIQETVKNQKFPFDQEKKITLKSISAFVKSFVDGEIEPSIKSEPIPETQDSPVIVVVAHSYKDIVFDDEKDVLLEFYAPWCGHCKSLAPKYEELASLYANNADFANKVVIAKVDATANDVPDEIAGFPTIKLFPAGAKDAPITYSGSRTVEDLAAFIAENGKYKAKLNFGGAEVEDAAESLGEAAAAATKKASSVVDEATKVVKSKAAEATDSVKSAASAAAGRDEL